MTRRLLLPSALLAAAASLGAAEGSAWLKIPQGARSAALGQAISSYGRGAEALWYTPAALGRVRGLDLSLSRQAWLGKTRDDLASVAVPVPGGAIGGYVNWLGDEDVYRDAAGVEGDKFSNGAWAGGLGYGFRLGFLSAGVLGKVINEHYASMQSSGYASDLGLQARLGPWLRLGGAIQNLGAWSGQASLGSVELPLTYRGGIALENAIPGVTLSLEARALPRSQESSALAGGEYVFHSGFFSGALRAGYEASAASLGEAAGLNLGAGAQFTGLKVDFAYSPYASLGNPYRMTLGWDFGQDPAAPAATRQEEKLPPSLAPAAPAETVVHLNSPEPAAASPTAQSSVAAPAAGSLDARLAEARASYSRGDMTAAEAQFKALADEYPANAKPFAGLFQVYYRQGRHDEAVQALTEKLARAPDPTQQAWLEKYKNAP
jgi:hypothetical protein